MDIPGPVCLHLEAPRLAEAEVAIDDHALALDPAGEDGALEQVEVDELAGHEGRRHAALGRGAAVTSG